MRDERQTEHNGNVDTAMRHHDYVRHVSLK